jgi:hypothetical protein
LLGQLKGSRSDNSGMAVTHYITTQKMKRSNLLPLLFPPPADATASYDYEVVGRTVSDVVDTI